MLRVVTCVIASDIYVDGLCLELWRAWLRQIYILMGYA